MWGCRFCVRMQDKWRKFEEEVDDVVPLAVREVGLEPGGWVENYTKEELRKVQLEDEIVGKVLRWLELGGEPQREELLLADPAVKYFWRFKENLAIRAQIAFLRWPNVGSTLYTTMAHGRHTTLDQCSFDRWRMVG